MKMLVCRHAHRSARRFTGRDSSMIRACLFATLATCPACWAKDLEQPLAHLADGTSFPAELVGFGSSQIMFRTGTQSARSRLRGCAAGELDALRFVDQRYLLRDGSILCSASDWQPPFIDPLQETVSIATDDFGTVTLPFPRVSAVVFRWPTDVDDAQRLLRSLQSPALNPGKGNSVLIVDNERIDGTVSRQDAASVEWHTELGDYSFALDAVDAIAPGADAPKAVDSGPLWLVGLADGSALWARTANLDGQLHVVTPDNLTLTSRGREPGHRVICLQLFGKRLRYVTADAARDPNPVPDTPATGAMGGRRDGRSLALAATVLYTRRGSPRRHPSRVRRRNTGFRRDRPDRRGRRVRRPGQYPVPRVGPARERRMAAAVHVRRDSRRRCPRSLRGEDRGGKYGCPGDRLRGSWPRIRSRFDCRSARRATH